MRLNIRHVSFGDENWMLSGIILPPPPLLQHCTSKSTIHMTKIEDIETRKP
jgi:hypothetical protein